MDKFLKRKNELAALENVGSKPLPAPPILPEEDSSPTDPLFRFLKSKNAARALNEKVDSTKSLNHYLSQSHKVQDPLEFWKNCAEDTIGLQTLAKRYLTIPATSTESERMFSKAAEVISTKRTLLKPENVNRLLFLNKNVDL
ncbi:uncharacterized protein LOC123037825 [Drosophila rhopaloa]|uniref:HAT C-terminal dimerisation domain-containing protein n=1 Tax=Drosophila rhopaloa TaxID=1041015 RepID=A0ABM5JC23_DRORH|nr:uncharacterized protein LOC123037825 [Drosophila rhopaloa]